MSQPFRLLRSGLVALVALCLVLRLAAWLIAPALPVIVVLLVIVTLLRWTIFYHR